MSATVPNASEADWTRVDSAEPVERIDLDDLDVMAEVTHPIRGLILRRLKSPRSVAQLADAMQVPVTRLYHHVNRLLEQGLIRVVATRQVGAVTERSYQVAAKMFRIRPDLFDTMDDHEMALALGSAFDLAKLGLQRVVESGGFRNVEVLEDYSMLSLDELHLSPARRVELVRRLRALVAEYVADSDEHDPGTKPVALFVAAYPEAM
jgi:DNA-binding transcriptional ArsR family regulator